VITASGATPILLWRWTPSQKTSLGEVYNSSWKLVGSLEFFWKLLMVVLTCAYFIDFILHKAHKIIVPIPKEPVQDASSLVPEPTASWWVRISQIKVFLYLTNNDIECMNTSISNEI